MIYLAYYKFAQTCFDMSFMFASGPDCYSGNHRNDSKNLNYKVDSDGFIACKPEEGSMSVEIFENQLNFFSALQSYFYQKYLIS